MTGTDLSTFEDIAFPEFQRQFAQLFSIRAQIEDFEYGLIVSVWTFIKFSNLDAKDSSHWDKTVRAAFHFLEKGTQFNEPELCKAYVKITNDIPAALNSVMPQKEAAENIVDGDARTLAFLALYKAICEGLMTVIAAPVVFGFALAYDRKDTVFKPKADGRVSLSALDKMEKWLLFPQNRLKEGLNRHVRNAYSHQRFRILDGDFVEMWDEDPRGRKTWGPESWPLAQLETLCERLLITAFGIIGALAIFGINYRSRIVARNWVPETISNPPMRDAEIQQIVDVYARTNGFRLVNFSRSNRELRLTLQTKSRGIDQNEEIIIGGKARPRRYIKPVQYERTLVVQGVLGLLQRAASMTSDVDKFCASVNDENNDSIGEFCITGVGIRNTVGPKQSSIEVERQRAETDTLGSTEMWIRFQGPIRPA